MSEEEKIAKLELNRFIYGKQLSKDDIADYLGILFNLIEKQQKEIEKLKKKRYIVNAETGEIKEIPISDNYISKDKIREILKKYKGTSLEDYRAIINFYKEIEELLEENIKEENS